MKQEQVNKIKRDCLKQKIKIVLTGDRTEIRRSQMSSMPPKSAC